MQTWHSWLADFALTGVTLQDPKAVHMELIRSDKDVLASVYALPQFWAQLVLVSAVVVADIPVYSSDYSGIIL